MLFFISREKNQRYRLSLEFFFLHQRKSLTLTYCCKVFTLGSAMHFFGPLSFFSRPPAKKEADVFNKEVTVHFKGMRRHKDTLKRFYFLRKFFLLCASSLYNVSWRIKRSSCTAAIRRTVKRACLHRILIYNSILHYSSHKCHSATVEINTIGR